MFSEGGGLWGLSPSPGVVFEKEHYILEQEQYTLEQEHYILEQEHLY